MSNVRLSFLGRAQFERDGQIVDLRIGKMQALLAYLALAQQPQPREHLIDLLWAESHADAARKNLRNSLWRLRQQFGEAMLVSHDDHLSLAESVWTDVVAFESGLALNVPNDPQAIENLRITLALWRGPLLDGTKLIDAPDFELWLSGERSRLAHLYTGGAEQLLAIHQANGDWAAVADIAQQTLAVENMHEPTHVVLMEALARLDRRSDALRQFETLRDTLARELAIEPQPASLALRNRILSGEFTGNAARQSTDIASPQSNHQPTTSALQPFVGRAVERQALDDAMAIAAGGQLQVVMLAGELGIGKSTLWQRWSSRNQVAATTLETRCLESTQTLPLTPLTALFGRQICVNTIADPQSPLSTSWLTELSRLLPQIRDIRPDLPLASALPPEEERRRIFEALVQVLRTLPAPLVLFIDDLHWADQATLDWLAYLVNRLQTALLLVGAYRDPEASATLKQSVARWHREKMLNHLPLTPLSQDESASLIEALNGNVALVDYLHDQSGGNPYYLTELSRVHPDGRPVALFDLVEARLQALPEDAKRLLQSAAVLEPMARFDLLQKTSQWEQERALDALEHLLALGTLLEQDGVYAFAHPLVAGIVRDGMSVPRRRMLHQRAAQLLLAAHEDDSETISGQLARHYAEAGQPSEAANFADKAAHQAMELGAMLEAVNFRRQAVALEPTPTRKISLGYALMHVPDGMAEARTVVQQALADAEASSDRKAMVQAGLRMAFSYLSAEQGEYVLHWAERIQAAANGSEDIELKATIEYLMAAGKLNTPHRMHEANAHYREATRLVAEYDLNTEIAAQSWFGWGNFAVQCGDFSEAHARFSQTLALAIDSSNIYFEALCYNNMAYARLLAGDIAAARRTIKQGLAVAESNHLLHPRQYLYSTRGEVALAEGALDDAEKWFARAREEARVYNNETHLLNLQAHFGRVAWARGHLGAAAAQIESACRALPDSGATHLRIQLLLWLAELSLAQGRVKPAQEFLVAARQALVGTQRKALIEQAQTISALLDANRKPETSVTV